MTFSEKLARLRKREGLSQEELASYLGVSRQAVSRWEQGTAMPDAPNLVKLRQRFRVSLDWLLEDGRGWEELDDQQPGGETAPRALGRGWSIAGGAITGLSLLGLLLLGILSSVFPASVAEAPAGVEWVRGYTGLTGFLKYHHLEWLFALCLLTAFGGVLLLALPRIRRSAEGNPILRSNLALLAIAGQAGSLYGCAQSLWWLNQGQEHYRGPVWLYLALTLACSVWMAANLRREKDPRQRRKNSLIELGYCAAQAAVAVLTADMGLGLAGLALGVILLVTYLLVVNPRYMGRRFTRNRKRP